MIVLMLAWPALHDLSYVLVFLDFAVLWSSRVYCAIERLIGKALHVH
jgi:hypothetical protein